MCVRQFDDPGVLQFSLGIAAGCGLHRSTSRVIHRSECLYSVSFTQTRASEQRELRPNIREFLMMAANKRCTSRGEDRTVRKQITHSPTPAATKRCLGGAELGAPTEHPRIPHGGSQQALHNTRGEDRTVRKQISHRPTPAATKRCLNGAELGH